MLRGKAVHKALVLLLLFLFQVARFLQGGDRRLGFVFRLDRDLGKAFRESAHKFFDDHVLAVLSSVRAVRHADHKNVDFIQFDEFGKTRHQVGLFLIDRFTGKCPFHFGIRKSDPDAMFTVVNA